MFCKDVNDKLVGPVLHDVHDGVVQRILVLLKPARQVVRDGAGVVDDSKVCILVRLCHRLHKVGRLAQVVGLQFVLKGLVGGLRKERLFFEDCEDT